MQVGFRREKPEVSGMLRAEVDEMFQVMAAVIPSPNQLLK